MFNCLFKCLGEAFWNAGDYHHNHGHGHDPGEGASEEYSAVKGCSRFFFFEITFPPQPPREDIFLRVNIVIEWERISFTMIGFNSFFTYFLLQESGHSCFSRNHIPPPFIFQY